MSSDGPIRWRFQFSLKAYLIGICGLGMTVGVLGRLFLYAPEIFLLVLGVLSTVGPYLLAVGTIIRLGTRSGQRGLVMWGGALMMMPCTGMIIVGLLRSYAGSSPGALGLQSTSQLIQKQLPNQIDQPWVWDELHRRVQAGKLSQQQVDDAVNALVAHMTTTRPQGWNRPLSWQGKFLSSARQAKLISAPVRMKLCDAFFGPTPVMRPLPRVREGQDSFLVELDYGSLWANEFVGIQLLWHVDRVLVDGQPVKVGHEQKSDARWTGLCSGDLRAGDHELTVESECAYVDESRLVGLSPGELPKTRWPTAHKRWPQSVSAPLKVFSSAVTLVSLISDPGRSPGANGGIRVQRFAAQANEQRKVKITLKLEPAQALSIPLSFDVAAKLDGETVYLGSIWAAQTENGRQQGASQFERTLDALAPSVKAADILLTPNPKHIERWPDVSEIWGKPVVLRNEPLERLDLERKE